MKHTLIFLLAILVGILGATAQRLNINHSGIQTTYALPEVIGLQFNETGDALSVNYSADGVKPDVYNVADITDIEASLDTPDFGRKWADGKPAHVTFSCIEVNNVNPLQTLNFTLKRSRKNFFDAVILFSSNINFSKKENVVYIHNNDNVQAILNNYDHYLRPLKEKGIKVILSILGNHDGSGLANMDEARCREFATAIADTLDKYDLDGVFFDDEWSEYGKDLGGQGYSGFVPYSTTARASRLAYETKKAIGDRWLIPYKYGAFNNLEAVDGVEPGDYIDYLLNDYGVYGVWANIESSYPGLRPEQYGPASIAAHSYYINTSYLTRSRNDGYGAFMFYNLDQTDGYFEYYDKPTLETVADILYDDELVVKNTRYRKDWIPVRGLETPNR